MQFNQLLDENDLANRLKLPQGGGLDIKVLRAVRKMLKNKPKSFDDCVVYARLKFESYYSNKAKQLLHSFPLDHKVDAKGSKKWRKKRKERKEKGVSDL